MPTAAENARNRRAAQRSGTGGPGFRDFDALIGLDRQITGNQRIFEGDRTASLAERAGQGDITLGAGEQATLSQFFSPTVTGEQQNIIESFAKRAGGQGLQGRAVESTLGGIATQFVAGNRAASFGGVQDIIQARTGQINEAVNPFLQQVGDLRSGSRNSAQTLRASGETTRGFLQFANPGLRALSAVGLGADALAGVADQQGALFDTAGLQGRGDVSQAFEQFLNPGTGGFASFLSQRGVGSQFGRRAAVGGRNIARAQNRIGAAEQLAGTVGSMTQQINREATQFSNLGAAALSPFASGVDRRGTAQRLANLDLSQFEGLTSSLGIGAGLRTRQGAAGATRGTQFLAGNDLFSSVFGS